MSKKKEPVKKIDVKSTVEGGGTVVTQTPITVGPAIGSIPAPYNLVMTSTIVARSASTPMSIINITWDYDNAVDPEYYIIEFAYGVDSSNNLINPQKVISYVDSAALTVPSGTLTYIHVAAVLGAYISPYSTGYLTATSASDLTPPPAVTGLNVIFDTGNVVITWTAPSSSSYKDAIVRIWDITRTTWVEYTTADQHLIFTEAMNYTYFGGITSVSVDVTSRSWQNIQGPTVTTTATVLPPNPVSGVTNDFTTGDLQLKWTNPTQQYKAVVIEIWNSSSKTTKYRTFTLVPPANQTVWTVDMNFYDTNNNPDPSVYYVIYVTAWLGLVSTNVTGTATKPPPDPPTLSSQSWNNDTLGTAHQNLTLNWNSVPYVKDYLIGLDAGSVFVTSLQYVYQYSDNVKDHAGSLVYGDPNISYSLKSRDRLNQLSTTATTGTAINQAPGATLTILIQGFFSVVNVTLSQTIVINDFDHYVYKLYKSSSSGGTYTVVQTGINGAMNVEFTIDSPAWYKVGVRMYDKFNQAGTEQFSDPVYVDGLTLAQLRESVEYADYLGTNKDTLKTALSDGLLYGQGGPTITYNTSGTLQTLDQYRELTDRYRKIVLSGSGSGSAFIQTSNDGGITWRYFSGPGTPYADGYTLVEYANSGLANASRFVFPAAGTLYLYFPTQVEARLIRFVFVAGSYTFNELYTRRLIQTDDLEAESVKAIQLGASSVIADKIAAGAVTASKLTVGLGGGNLVTNGGFSSYGAGWTFDVPVSRSDGFVEVNNGNNYLCTGYYVYICTNTVLSATRANNYIYQDVTDGIIPAQSVMFTAYVSCQYGNVDAYLRMAFINDGNGSVIADVTTTPIRINNNEYQKRLSFQSVAPSGTTRIRVYVGWNYLTSGTQMNISGIQLELGDVATSWKPGYIGNVMIDGQAITVGIPNGARTTLTQGGLAGYNSSGTLQIQWRSDTGTLIAGTSGGARTEFNAAGIVGYDSSNILQTQVRSSDGWIIAGGGSISLNSGGLNIIAPLNTQNDVTTIKWLGASNEIGSGINAFRVAATNASYLNLYAQGYSGSSSSNVSLDAFGTGVINIIAHGTQNPYITLNGNSSADIGSGFIYIRISPSASETALRSSTSATNNLNVYNGSITTANYLYAGVNTIDTNIRAYIKSMNNNRATVGLRVVDSGGTINLDSTSDGALYVRNYTAFGGNIDPNAFVYIQHPNSSSGWPLYIKRSDGTTMFSVDAGGKTYGGAMLYVNNATFDANIGTFFKSAGALLAIRVTNSSNTVIMDLNNSGAMTIAGALTQNSDITLKTNFRAMPYGLQQVMNLTPELFDMINGDTNQLGFIAQKAIDIVPLLVSSNEGKYSFNYIQMVVVLVKAIQELAAFISAGKKDVPIRQVDSNGYMPGHVDTPAPLNTKKGKVISQDDSTVGKGDDGRPVTNLPPEPSKENIK